MELRLFLASLARGWYIVVAAVALGLLGGGLHAVTSTPTYVSTARLLVNVRSAASIDDLATANSLSQQLAANYAQLAGTQVVLKRAATLANVGVSAADLESMVSAVATDNTAFITITAQGASGTAAAKVANAVSSSLIAASQSLAAGNASANRTLQLEAVQAASTPLSPSSGSLRVELPLGGAIGLILGIVVIVLRDRFDSRFRSMDRVAVVTDADILGVLPATAGAKSTPALELPTKRPRRYELFRSLRTSLDGQGLAAGGGIIAVTSSVPAEGKSSVAAGLAVAIAATGRQVVVVESDLRRPTVAKALGVAPGAGLTDVLAGRSSAEGALQAVGPEGRIRVLRAGSPEPGASERFESPELVSLLDELRADEAVVIIDTPPLLVLSDAASLARRADHVVLVVGASVVKEREVKRALTVLRRVKVTVSGVVVNRVPRFWPDSGVGDYSADTELVGGASAR